MNLKEREVVEYGKGKRKRKIIFIRKASGIDKRREAALIVLGPDWTYVGDDENNMK